jgi:flagellar basal body-associated protein FliL
MSDKAEKKPEAAPAPAKDAEKKEDGAKKAGGGLLAKTPVLLGIAMVLEAIVLFAGFKFLGGGAKPAHADIGIVIDEGGKGEGGKEGGKEGGEHSGPRPSNEKEKQVDIVQNFKARNAQNGRSYIYDLSVAILVKSENEEKVKEKVKARDAVVKDRIRTVVAQIDPEKLGASEPGLETLRRQIKSQLEIIVGEGMIEEVLVPSCTPFRADF